MRISDEITAYILHIMEQAENGAAELQMTPLMHVVNSIGDELVPAAAEAILQSMVYQGFITQRAGAVMAAALSDRSYRDVPPELRDRLRAALLKQMLTAYTV